MPPDSNIIVIDGKEIDLSKIDVHAELREIDRIECEESLYRFLQGAWKFIDSAPFKPGWVLDALAEHLEAVADGQLKRLIINIPPRCGKSSIVSVAFGAWLWAQPERMWSPTCGPGVPMLHASYAYNLCLRDSVKARRLIKSPWYQQRWGNRFQILSDQDQKIRFRNTRGGERLITSVDASVTGEGGNVIIVDDPNNAKEVLSEAIIQSTNEEWWDGAMSTRLNDAKTGAIIVIQQRLGERDLTGHILANDRRNEWQHLMLPMEYEPERSFVTSIGWKDPRKEQGELLWPERFGPNEVRDLKERLKEWGAAGQLQQRPMPKGGGIIKYDWWKLWPPGGEEFDRNGDPIKPAAFPACDFVLASLDTAYTEKTMNDPSALTIWGVFSGDVVAQDVKVDEELTARIYAETGMRVILLYAWTGHFELNPLVNHVAKMCGPVGRGGFNVDRLLVEDKAAGHSVVQELRRLYTRERFAVQLINPRKMKNANGEADKLARLFSVSHLFEEGMIYAPERKWSSQVMDQCAAFPNGTHDDLVDTVSMALRWLRDQGLLERGPEITAEMTDSMLHKPRQGKLYPTT